MVERDLNSEYFEWLCSLIRDSKPQKHVSYKRLMMYLYHSEFIPSLPMDENRCIDGIDLRYRFGYERGIDIHVIASCLDTSPCSILEMMVALAFYCEEHIMFEPENGIMSGRWFWMMVSNLGLGNMYDSNYDEAILNNVILKFLNRDYSRDGAGGLVYIPNCIYDLRQMDIWYQLMTYFSEIEKNRA